MIQKNNFLLLEMTSTGLKALHGPYSMSWIEGSCLALKTSVRAKKPLKDIFEGHLVYIIKIIQNKVMIYFLE